MGKNSPCESASQGAGPYARLASEYDRAEHETTRVLETLSATGLRRAERNALQTSVIDDVLEVGAGTGSLTAVLLELWPRAEITATDASPEMLDVLASKIALADAARVTLAVADAYSSVRESIAQPDLIAAGLADPYLDATVLSSLREACRDTTRLFVSVPSRRWARRERLERLGVPVDTTRFRAIDGGIVFARSSTFDEDGLRALCATAGFAAVATGTERSDALWSRPEVCWAVASPTAPLGLGLNRRISLAAARPPHAHDGSRDRRPEPASATLETPQVG
jgi:precorrin-6B methylase 2